MWRPESGAVPGRDLKKKIKFLFIGREIEMGQSENRSWNLTSVIQVDGRVFFSSFS